MSDIKLRDLICRSKVLTCTAGKSPWTVWLSSAVYSSESLFFRFGFESIQKLFKLFQLRSSSIILLLDHFWAFGMPEEDNYFWIFRSSWTIWRVFKYKACSTWLFQCRVCIKKDTPFLVQISRLSFLFFSWLNFPARRLSYQNTPGNELKTRLEN